MSLFWIVERLLVRRDVAAVFRHRQRAILHAFGVEGPATVDVRLGRRPAAACARLNVIGATCAGLP